MTASGPAGSAAHVDLEVAGVAHVRLVGASPTGVARVQRTLGAARVHGRLTTTSPDLTVRFGEDLSAPLTLVGPDAGYGPHGLVVLRGPRRARVRVDIPLDRVEGGLELRCEGRDGPIPHLVGLLHLTLLARGILPLHASAFVVDGRTVLVAGWARGGKTELLAGFTRRGATYVGDEWIVVDEDGRLHGMPEPVRLRQWHLDQLPDARRAVPLADRVRLAGLRLTSRALATTTRVAPATAATTRRIDALLREQAWVQLPPEEVFGRRQPSAPSPAQLFLTVGRESDEYAVDEVAATEVVQRLAISTAFELRHLEELYRASRFAAPADDRRSPLLEDLDGRILALATARLPADVPAHVLAHPQPFDVARLHTAAAGVLDGPGAQAAGGRPATPSVVGA